MNLQPSRTIKPSPLLTPACPTNSKVFWCNSKCSRHQGQFKGEIGAMDMQKTEGGIASRIFKIFNCFTGATSAIANASRMAEMNMEEGTNNVDRRALLLSCVSAAALANCSAPNPGEISQRSYFLPSVVRRLPSDLNCICLRNKVTLFEYYGCGHCLQPVQIHILMSGTTTLSKYQTVRNLSVSLH